MIQLFVTPEEYKKIWWFEILELCGPVFTLKDIIDKVEEVSGEKRHQNNIKRDLMAMGAIIETVYKVKVKNGRPPHLFVRNPDFKFH